MMLVDFQYLALCSFCEHKQCKPASGTFKHGDAIYCNVVYAGHLCPEILPLGIIFLHSFNITCFLYFLVALGKTKN